MKNPAPAPYATLKLPVGEGHTLHIEESGNPRGIPVIILHGGPGGGISDSNHKRFPAKTYRRIAFDQRGCGQSKSTRGPLHANTTQALIADIEKIRTYLNIEKWVVSGSSWGSTLALAYAQAHPTRVLGLIVAAVFLGTKHEIDWFTQPHGVARFFPTEYQNLLTLSQATPATLAKKSLAALTGKNKPLAQNLARAWNMFEGLACTPTPNRAMMQEYLDSKTTLLTGAQIEVHYFAHECFLKPDQLIKNIARIAHIPTHIVHGELDMVCPPESAWRLHAAHPKSQLTMVKLAGHYGHPALEKARMAAAKALAKTLLKKSR